MIKFVLLCVAALVVYWLCTPVRFARSLPWRPIDVLKNNALKLRHRVLGVPLNAATCAENLRLFAGVMDDLDIPFWLSEGTALGARREGGFIAHDDDVDVGAWFADLPRFRRSAIPRLKALGFSLDLQQMDGTFFCLSRNFERLDVDFTGKDVECIACKTSFAQCDSCDPMLALLQRMDRIDFNGGSYLCPREEYLEYLYGPTWRTPQRAK